MLLRPHARRHLPALAAVPLVSLVLAACGDTGDDRAADSLPPAEAPPATTAPTTGGGMRAPTPIRFTPGALGSPEARSATPTAASEMIAPTYVAEFVVADDLPALPTVDTGFVYTAGTPTTAEQAAAIAAVFGVTGDVLRVGEWEPGGWQVGPTDGTAPSVFLGDDAQHNWSYSPAWDTMTSDAWVGCAAVEGDELAADCVVPSTTVPTPPAGIPTADEARARADELLAALGVDSTAMAVDTYADEWSASVNVSEPSTGRYWNFGFGAEGELQWANGTIGVPEPVGPYPLIDLDTALARLDEYQFGMVMPFAVPGPAVDVGVIEPAAEPAIDAVPPTTGDVVVPDVTFPAPEPITVTLVDVQADVWWAWDASGDIWIVPAYRFIGDDGGWYTVPAVTDEFLIEVPAPEILPLETFPAPTIPVTVPVSDTVADVELPIGPSDTAPLDSLVGACIEEFSGAAEALGFSVRITEIDGQPQPATRDFRPSRVNVAVETTPDACQTVTAILNLG